MSLSTTLTGKVCDMPSTEQSEIDAAWKGDRFCGEGRTKNACTCLNTSAWGPDIVRHFDWCIGIWKKKVNY